MCAGGCVSAVRSMKWKRIGFVVDAELYMYTHAELLTCVMRFFVFTFFIILFIGDTRDDRCAYGCQFTPVQYARMVADVCAVCVNVLR